MTLLKIIINSTISTRGAKCMMIDLSNFYLKTPMTRREYMCLKITDIPEEIIKQYNWETSLHQTNTYTAKSTRECTAYPNQE
jgi:hypothetical protein